MQGGRGHMGRASYLTDEEKKNSPKVTGALLKRVFSYLKPYWKQLALVLACIAVASVCSLFPSILTGSIVDVLTGKSIGGWIGAGVAALVRLIILSLGLHLMSNLIGVGQNYLNTWIAQHISYDMRNQMYRHLQKMSQRFYTSANQGDIITRMTSDISGVESVVTGTFASILSNTITLVVAVIAMFQKNWILALVGLVVVPLFTLPTRMAGKTRWKLASEAQACNDEINGILNETLSVSGQLLTKLFGREKAEYRRYEEANGRMIKLNIRERMAGRWFFMLLSTLTAIGPMLLYLVGGILMMEHGYDLTVGDITVLVALLGRMYGPVNSLLNIQVDWIRSMAMFTRIFEYYDMKPEIDDKPGAKELTNAKGEVRFEHVDFSYDGKRDILKDISFELKSGDCIAIVGPSGSGKSTIVNLIPRLWDVCGGSVKFDGGDVRDYTLASLRDEIGVVTQETYLFNGTIRDNLSYAKPGATEEEMVEACKKANIYDFIKNQPDGLDTMVGNRGLKLSGGEKQRISIARVLLKDPALLIFDEATSALDSISEAAIQAAINPLIEERTSILIAHRLSTILAADEILVVRDGRIVERGKHSDLVHAGGTYQELYETQFSKADA
ncbi:MAG: ABC transporter ATP-binding protein [Clostridia bacterium]|nr:ABC transporter ATP-binding protein [Clostridia bacterium]MCR4576750.1 ABC transporter ATP-binding protein/permease [Clostridiales bacterium]